MLLLVLHVQPQFSRRMLSGQPAPLQVIVDGRNSNTALIALNYVRTVVTTFNEDRMAARGSPSLPARLETRAWFNPNLESRWFFIPGIIGVLTLLVTMLITALSVAREREQGTFDQLLVTPLRPVEILVGKALPGFLIGIVEATLILLVATLWFRVPLVGSLATLYAGLALFLLSAVGMGLLISSLAVTQQQGLLGAFLFMVPAVILSGFATPIANMPKLRPAHHAARPAALFPGDPAQDLPRGRVVAGADPRVLADGADRPRQSVARRLAVPPSNVLTLVVAPVAGRWSVESGATSPPRPTAASRRSAASCGSPATNGSGSTTSRRSAGCRASEITGLEWSRVDLQRGTAWLNHTKNGTPRGVPLNEDAVAVLEAERGKHAR